MVTLPLSTTPLQTDSDSKAQCILSFALGGGKWSATCSKEPMSPWGRRVDRSHEDIWMERQTE
jgi:hypothetical protein